MPIPYVTDRNSAMDLLETKLRDSSTTWSRMWSEGDSITVTTYNTNQKFPKTCAGYEVIILHA